MQGGSNTLYLLHTLAVKLTFKTLETGIMWIVHFGLLDHWRPEKRTGHSEAVYKYAGRCLMMNKLVLQHVHEGSEACCSVVLRWRCVSARPDRPW